MTQDKLAVETFLVHLHRDFVKLKTLAGEMWHFDLESHRLFVEA